MNKIKSISIIAVLLTAAIIIGSIFSKQNKEDLRKSSKNDLPRQTEIIVKNVRHNKIIKTSGRMYAFNKVEIFSEVNGVLENKSNNFRDGFKFKKGEILLSIDDDVYINSILAQKSNLLNQLTLLISDMKLDFPGKYQVWQKYLLNFDINTMLAPLPEDLDQRQKIYVASHNIYKLYYDIKSMEATFAKYTIKAPFDGIVKQSNISPGTLVRNGQKLGEFINSSLYEMAAPVNFSDLDVITIGKEVELSASYNDKIFKGRVVRINNSVDQQSQSVKVYIQSKDKQIIDGMFFNAVFKVRSRQKLASIPIKAVTNGNQVKIKTKNNTKYINISIIEKTASSYLVTGLKDSTIVIIDNSAK